MKAETLTCLGGMKDREEVTVESHRRHITWLQAPPLTIRDIQHAKPLDTIQCKEIVYERVLCRAGDATMTARGGEEWFVLLPAGATDAERTWLWERDTTPIVDGGHPTPRWGQPGNGCPSTERLHEHWCGTCGHRQLFSHIQCRLLANIPACPQCTTRDWRIHVDPAVLMSLDIVQ